MLCWSDRKKGRALQKYTDGFDSVSRKTQRIQRDISVTEIPSSSDTDALQDLGLLTYGSGLRHGPGYVSCPDSVLNDMSRLEVLFGGRQAGNN